VSTTTTPPVAVPPVVPPPVVPPVVPAPVPAPVAAPPVVPHVRVEIGRQRFGCFVVVRVQGEPLWVTWRATEPTEAERLDLEVAARSAIAARGATPMADLVPEVATMFGGDAKPVLTETLAVDAPKDAVAGVATTYTGEYTGADPLALDFWFDAGVRASAGPVVIGSGKWSFETPAPAAGKHTLTVKVAIHDGPLGVSAGFATTAAGPVVVPPVGPQGVQGVTGATGSTARTSFDPRPGGLPAPTTDSSAAGGTTSALTVVTPGPQVTGKGFRVSGTYAGPPPSGLLFAFGSAPPTAAPATIDAGSWSFEVADHAVPLPGSHTLTVETSPNDLPQQRAVSNSFVVAAAAPGT
jgi:hypothetical protein